jgi:hypothetical protein
MKNFFFPSAPKVSPKEAVFGVPELSLVPDRAVLGVAHVGTAVVARLPFDLGVAELQVEHRVAELSVA